MSARVGAGVYDDAPYQIWATTVGRPDIFMPL